MNDGKLCGPHFRRTGKLVPAVRAVDNEGMYANCFNGKAIHGGVERGFLFRGRMPKQGSRWKREEREGALVTYSVSLYQWRASL